MWMLKGLLTNTQRDSHFLQPEGRRGWWPGLSVKDNRTKGKLTPPTSSGSYERPGEF